MNNFDVVASIYNYSNEYQHDFAVFLLLPVNWDVFKYSFNILNVI
jgi:hypothetical protein